MNQTPADAPQLIEENAIVENVTVENASDENTSDENAPDVALLSGEVPTPYALREELLRLMLNDLEGPAAGANEVVDELYVSERYLVGMLAPMHGQEKSQREQQDTLGTGTGAKNAGDDEVEESSLLGDTMFPSSFGLTFAVPLEITHLEIGANWGNYRREESPTLQKTDGTAKQIWQRYPIEATWNELPLCDGTLLFDGSDRWKPERDQEVWVQGFARRAEEQWLVSLFLVNGQTAPRKNVENRDVAWIFQPQLQVSSHDKTPIFRCYQPHPTSEGDQMLTDERDALRMAYRHCTEFAVGHGVSVHAEVDSTDSNRAFVLRTRNVPQYEVAQQTPPTAQEVPALSNVVLDMKLLAESDDEVLSSTLHALCDAYANWIEGRKVALQHDENGLLQHERAAQIAIENAARACERMRAGVRVLDADVQARAAFRFANRAMWLQRVHTLFAENRRQNVGRSENANGDSTNGENANDAPTFDSFDIARNRSWRPFQLAFILLNLPSLTDVTHADRAADVDATADLLWFPTGGGKTEAYLGLTAYTLGMRRLQGVVAGRVGEHGVAVLMRYTLRLLTLQQFQRAAALICACETIRRESVRDGQVLWGREPFRLGLWVGAKTTPNKTADAEIAINDARGNGFVGGVGSPAQLTNCPWCGHEISVGRDIIVDKTRERTLLYCGDKSGACDFSRKGSPDEGLPVVVVDDEIYRRLPSLLISTVDKFAQMPWNGKTQMLFGQVDGWCPRHGFTSPDVKDASSHPARNGLPAVKTQAHANLRPPDLIIQDELHLISGPLGTLVGLYETAVDELCSWQVEGKMVRPKVIASTATIRSARRQVHSLFARRVAIFPPQGTDARDNFFSRAQEPSPQVPGRLYVGICAPGKRVKATSIRVYLAQLAAAQMLYQRWGKHADAWMTCVGYFGSMRELGGMRRLLEDDVASRLKRIDRRGLATRRAPIIQELTSRQSASDIPRVLDALERGFDPVEQKRLAQSRKAGRKNPHDSALIDVLLATNMISVGVDVRRLGMMIVSGQPKSTSEYIQATSRVGRATPGLVLTVFNWARPRDLSHYERFEHYHATFYQHVEALSVTPFAPRALDRGLAALLVSLIRLQSDEFNANDRAMSLDRNHVVVQRAVRAIVERAENVTEEQPRGAQINAQLQRYLDEWQSRATKTGGGSVLGYKDASDGRTLGLLQEANRGDWETFTCLNSLRDVEPMVNLVLDEALTESE